MRPSLQLHCPASPSPRPAGARTRRSTPTLRARLAQCSALLLALALLLPTIADAQRTVKPVLHGSHWVAITGKPLGATAGAMIFQRGGNAVDAACAMLGATSTMWDTLGWGGETQALIYNPHPGEVKGINAHGFAPTGETVEFFRDKGMRYPSEFGPLILPFLVMRLYAGSGGLRFPTV